MKKRISTLLCLLALAMTSMQAKDYNVKDFGATGNGKVLDHHAINTAIDSCVAHGGGRVVLPAGTYLCGSIRMKSHVELHLLKANPDSNYDLPQDVIDKTIAKYLEAYELLTGKKL